MRSRLPLLFAVVATVLTTSPNAQATLEPEVSEAIVRARVRDGSLSMCRAKPPPRNVLDARPMICGHVERMAGCQGLKAACAARSGDDQGWLTKWLESSPTLKQWLSTLAGWMAKLGQAFGSIAKVAIMAAVVVVSVLLLWIAVRSASRRRRTPSDPTAGSLPSAAPLIQREGGTKPTPETPHGYLARGHALAARGELRAAVAAYFAAGISALAARGELQSGAADTHGDAIRACTAPEAVESLTMLARAADAAEFAPNPPTAEDEVVARGRAEALVKRLLAPLALLILASCSAESRGSGFASDPLGHDLLGEMLQQQGVRVGPLKHSLASLPIQEPLTAVVFIDLQRTSVDEETRAHLERYLRAGGRLVLAGHPEQWPSPIAMSSTRSESETVTIDDGEAGFLPGRALDHVALRMGPSQRAIAMLGSDAYATTGVLGLGQWLGVASGELFTNVALVDEGSATVATFLLDVVEPTELLIASEQDGISPPDNPLSSLIRAGFGAAMLHALLALCVFYRSRGMRLTRPIGAGPPARRDERESILATGRLYAAHHLSFHALAAVRRYVEAHIGGGHGRHAHDVPSLLAQSGTPLAECEEVWRRAKALESSDDDEGDALRVLERLLLLFRGAMADAHPRK